MLNQTTFNEEFTQLTGHAPFPWQCELYRLFAADKIPKLCTIPTGLGKTSIVAVWLIALADYPESVPRRLIYVVNRRTVVDQTTNEVERLRERITESSPCEAIRNRLREISGDTDGCPLAISTLRGQFADNREWSANPARPAVIVGTVDMIGSRLLFSGYGIGYRTRPLQAGLLGQDSLLVHDEAHLEPAFQRLLDEIEAEQRRTGELRPLKVIELSATSRNLTGSSVERDRETVLTITGADKSHEIVKKRIGATKRLALHEVADPKTLADELAKRALEFKDRGATVLVFAREVDAVEDVVKKLKKDKSNSGTANVLALTGTMRGLERDKLVELPAFARFLPINRSEGIHPADGAVYLVCTSAGEVGVNISADHLVCDLSTFESMAQRFGRVNRFGDRNDTEIHVYYPQTFDEESEMEQRLHLTLELLNQLAGDASPSALSALRESQRVAAFSPPPIIYPVSDILFDSWSMTTIREKIPGRPPVAGFLHGVAERELPQTEVAWRKEVDLVKDELLVRVNPKDLLEDYPLKPHELLRDRSDRIIRKVQAIAQRHREQRCWIVDDQGEVAVTPLSDLIENKNIINNKTVLLPPSVGGLGFVNGESTGMLHDSVFQEGFAERYDVADEWFTQMGPGQRVKRRIRVWSDESNVQDAINGTRLIRSLELSQEDEDDDAEPRRWLWLERPDGADGEGSRSAKFPILLDVHVSDVEQRVHEIIGRLPLPVPVAQALELAGKHHDRGKRRPCFQRSLGNFDPTQTLAKSGLGSRPIELGRYRHEFGSLLDAAKDLASVDEDVRDLALHFIAAHHGRGRPHFHAEEAIDPSYDDAMCRNAAIEVACRFARLQRRYGRWGLAYYESILRAADYAASAKPSIVIANPVVRS